MAKRVAKRAGAADPKKQSEAASPADAPDLAHIAADLHYLAVPIDTLRPDPDNANTHPEENLAAIAASLTEFGQQTPVVSLPDGTVIAGNGVLEAALGLGWTHLAAHTVELDRTKAIGFGLVDNYTAGLSDWDTTILRSHLEGLRDLEGDLFAVTGFSSDELDDLIASSLTAVSGSDPDPEEHGDDDPPAEPPSPNAGEAGSEEPPAEEPLGQYHLLVECDDADDRNTLCEQLDDEGLTYRRVGKQLPAGLSCH